MRHLPPRSSAAPPRPSSWRRTASRLAGAGLLLASLNPALASAPHSERGGLQTTALADQPSSTAAVLDPLRSLAITDFQTLSLFSLQEVMNQLTQQGTSPDFTSEQLFRQLWDTQNPAPGQPDLPHGAHCSDNGGTLNGAPYTCRPNEGAEAILGPESVMARYNPIGLFNRFDLAPPDGANCGEYRIVFARGFGSNKRNLVIFEAVVPNPRPDLGLEGCRPIAQTWASLSTLTDPVARGALVKSFFMDATGPGQPPVIHINHLGNNALRAGQIRTNQFIQGPGASFPWLLREFKLRQQCLPGGSCPLRFVPVTVKANPRGDFFDVRNTSPLAVGFRAHFITQVASLAVNDINRFNYEVPDLYNAAQSNSEGMLDSDNYLHQFLLAPPNNPFAQAITTELQRIGSTLRPEHIVARAQSLSCAGCHNLSSNTDLGGPVSFFPDLRSAFTHNTELPADGFPPEDPHFTLSNLVQATFLPFRQQLLGAFLDTPALGVLQHHLDSRIRTVVAGQPFTAEVTVSNTGTTLWSPGNATRGVSLDGVQDLTLSPGETLLLGQRKTFTLTLTAPMAPGSKTYRWRMQRDGVPFGDELRVTVFVRIPAFGAELVAQSPVPDTLANGEAFQFSVRMRNRGTQTWSPQQPVELVSQHPTENLIWGVARIPLQPSQVVAPGEEATFTFTAVAPFLTGSYPFEWRLAQGTSMFGPSTTPRTVTVTPPLTCDSCTWGLDCPQTCPPPIE
ncbi:NBR1-Ig-like domain-containing protein [Myxococcus stipitatus]|uniref:COG1470 family protein n=1 Tax=Myxococcus stipitatus TaxID=83455 RepID=UPI0031455F56